MSIVNKSSSVFLSLTSQLGIVERVPNDSVMLFDDILLIECFDVIESNWGYSIFCSVILSPMHGLLEQDN